MMASFGNFKTHGGNRAIGERTISGTPKFGKCPKTRGFYLLTGFFSLSYNLSNLGEKSPYTKLQDFKNIDYIVTSNTFETFLFKFLPHNPDF